MSAKPDIADKIRKLLAKASDSGVSEAEAASFLSAAMALMEKHNLARSQIDASAPGHGYRRGVAHEVQDAMPLNWMFVMPIVEKVCEVHAVVAKTQGFLCSTSRFEIFGDKANVETATVLMKYLAGVFQDLWTAHKVSTLGRPKDEAGYYEGLRAGILVRLDAEKAERDRKRGSNGTGLVLSRERLDTAFAEEYPPVEMLNVQCDERAFDAGARDSGKVSLWRKIYGS